jgi:acetyl esterase/lipase
MKKILMTLLLAIVALSASAQKTISYEGADETVRLWDNKTAKYTNYETRDEAWKKKNSIWQTSSCELYIFKAAEGKNTGIAVAIFPGGSYTNLNLQISLAQWYASQGITAAIVKYRLPNRGHYEATLEDAMGAVRYLRTRSDLGIDPAKVGVTGSSAGGHLSTWVSNAMPVGEKPAFVIPLYGWINLYESKSLAAEKALVQLLGPGYNSQKAINLSTHLMVDENTSPTLLFLCYDDSSVPSTDGVEYYEALVRHGVKASMHIFPFGGHSVKKHTAEYQTLIIEWLKYLGLISEK